MDVMACLRHGWAPNVVLRAPLWQACYTGGRSQVQAGRVVELRRQQQQQAGRPDSASHAFQPCHGTLAATRAGAGGSSGSGRSVLGAGVGGSSASPQAADGAVSHTAWGALLPAQAVPRTGGDPTSAAAGLGQPPALMPPWRQQVPPWRQQVRGLPAMDGREALVGFEASAGDGVWEDDAAEVDDDDIEDTSD
jgi:hypothetical protein